jgi:UDP-GlcNAc:undecaprenyl-phosphate GlcNAc-1-phosphate transferase
MSYKTAFGKMFYFLIIFALIFFFTPYGKSFFSQTGIRWIYVLLISSCISYLLVPMTIMLSEKMGALDYPDRRKVHPKPTPLLGGLAVYLAFIISMFANFIFSTAVRGIIFGGTLIVIIGISDDLFKNRISARLKLFIQILATFIVIESGVSLSLFHETHLWGRLINIFLTIFWVVGLTNAMNFIDGMDGLATGLSGIIAFFLGIVAFQTHQPFLGWFAVAILGACLGFLPYNFKWGKPASVFLGDTGSTFLGFTLACLAILGEWADLKPIVSLAAPLLIFGILIFDMCYITFTRLKRNTFRNLNEFIEYVGKDHLHHRLDGLFHSKSYTVIFIYFLSITLGLAAVVLRDARTIDALLLILQAVIILLIVTILEQEGKKRRKTGEKETD